MNRFFGRWDSMRAKLLRVVVVSFSLGTAICGAVLLILGNNTARSNLTQGLLATANIIADRSAAALLFVDPEQAKQNLAAGENRQSIDYLCLYDLHGNLFAGYRIAADAGDCQAQVARVSDAQVVQRDDAFYVSVPVQRGTDLLGSLQIKANSKALKHSQAMFSLVLLGALLASLSVAYYLASKMVNRALIPLSALYKTSLVVANNPFSKERALKISNDEIGRLVDVFNDMLDGLSHENNALTLSETRFRSLSENAPIGVYLKSEDGDYEYINSKWEEFSGLRIGNAALFSGNIDPRDRRRYAETHQHASATQAPQTLEYRYTNPETGERVFMEYISPMPGEPHGQRFIGSLLDVTELKNAQVELERLAFYDPLTHLPNRRFFRDHLDLAIARAQKDNTKLAIYMTDLDDFKKVNDSLGHSVGDKLLVDIAKRLQKAIYEGDLVSRMGGDEFMVLVENIDDPTHLDRASQRFLEALNTQANFNGHLVEVQGSMGIAIFPTDAQTPDELIRYADIALYNAKETGGNKVSYYSDELDKRIKEKLRIEQKLRAALAANQLQVYIQPQYESGSQRMIWGEALVRWIDEEDGFIPPDIFIPLAEENGLIHKIGAFVFDAVVDLLCCEKERLNQLGIQGISVNLSAKQFYSPDLSEQVASKLRQARLDPAMIEFELTESMVMDDIDKAVTVMKALRELGCRLSIDDFGTGYSSLAYLKKFPLTSLKIDRSFIRDIPDDQSDVEISCAIIALAHNLGLSVVAEGVETEVQARLLADYDCEYLQGYFLDRPMPIADLLARADALIAVQRNKR